MPYIPMGKSEKQRRLLDRLDREFVACARRYNLPLGDFPNVDQYRKMLGEVSNEAEVCLHAIEKLFHRSKISLISKDWIRISCTRWTRSSLTTFLSCFKRFINMIRLFMDSTLMCG